MTMENDSILTIFFIYWLISGCICSIYFIEVIQHEEKWQDKVRDFVWNTGLDDSFWTYAAVYISFVFGFYYLPSWTIKKLTKKKDK